MKDGKKKKKVELVVKDYRKQGTKYIQYKNIHSSE